MNNRGFSLLECMLYLTASSIIILNLLTTIHSTITTIIHHKKEITDHIQEVCMWDIIERNCVGIRHATHDDSDNWIFTKKILTKNHALSTSSITWRLTLKGLSETIFTSSSQCKNTRTFICHYSKLTITPCFNKAGCVQAITFLYTTNAGIDNEKTFFTHFGL